MQDFAGCSIPSGSRSAGEDVAVLRRVLPSAFPVNQSSPAFTQRSRFCCTDLRFGVVQNAGFFERNSGFSEVVTEEQRVRGAPGETPG